MKPWTPTNGAASPPSTSAGLDDVVDVSSKSPTAHGPVMAKGARPFEKLSIMTS
jgi:hypothetical protein